MDVAGQFEELKVGETQTVIPELPSNPTETTLPAPESTARTISHFVMNLPGSALEFLDAYNGCYKPLLSQSDFPGVEAIEMPYIHVHCFSKEPEGDPARDDICRVSAVQIM